MVRTFRGHVESIKTDAATAVNVWVVDWRREPNLGRLEGVPVRHENLQLEGSFLVGRARGPLYHWHIMVSWRNIESARKGPDTNQCESVARKSAAAHITAAYATKERASRLYTPASMTLSLPSRGHAETPGGGSSSWSRPRAIGRSQDRLKQTTRKKIKVGLTN
jgi:hypothetical protein